MKSIYKKVLFIRLSSLGDIILTTPVLRAFKKKYTDSQIDFLTLDTFSEILTHNPNLDQVLSFKKSDNKSTLIKKLQKSDYDLVIDLQNNRRSKSICAKLSVREKYSFQKPTIKKILLVKTKINLYDNVYSIPEMYSKSIPGLILDQNGPELFYAEKVRADLNTIGFCPGSKHFTKMWPFDYFVELGNLLVKRGYKVKLIGGKDDLNICGELESLIPGAENSATENDFKKTCEHIKSCAKIVCNDSGLMHTATGLNVPVIAIFGSTVKEFGFFPYKSRNLVLENNDLSCRPCSHIGRNSCPKKHFSCMKDIKPEKVFNALMNLN